MKYLKLKLIRTIALIVLPFLLIMASCEDELVGIEGANTPVTNFELFWETFNSHYGLFAVKEVDWQHVYDTFRPRVNDQMTDAELYGVLTRMITLLNDNHLNLYPTNGELPVFPGGVLRYRDSTLSILKVQEDYSAEVIGNYVVGLKELSRGLKYGRIQKNIGYINFSGAESKSKAEKSLEKAINDLRDTDSMIIDIRGNYGGLDAISQSVAGRFSTERKLYMTTRKRNGSGADDFTDVTEWYIVPGGSFQYTRPVMVLTSRFTQSAGETFALAMSELEHVTLLGDTTAGSFSDNPTFEMHNGWMFSVSVGDYRAADGRSYEGTGIAPDITTVTAKSDLLAGKDPTLEKAIQLASR